MVLLGGGDGTFTDFPGGQVILNIGETLDEFTKFDPALGTLTEVKFSFDYVARTRVSIEADSVFDFDAPFDLFFDGSQEDNYTDIAVIYFPSNDVFGYSLVVEPLGFPSVGVIGEDPFQYEFLGNFYFQESDEFEFDEVEVEGFLSADDARMNLSDFVGEGMVNGLSFSMYGDISLVGEINNIETAFLQPEIEYEIASVTLQYEYIPSAPQSIGPKIKFYSKDGTTHTIEWEGNAGVSDWIVSGGSTLVSFPDDLTSLASINELSPGNYQAVISLPDLAASAYFFQISEVLIAVF